MRLTQKNEQGNWCVKGLEWEQLHVGQVITPFMYEKLYGALWKLMEYEDTGLTPEEIAELKEKNTVQKMYNPNPNMYYCLECGEKIKPMWGYCPWCGQRVTDN